MGNLAQSFFPDGISFRAKGKIPNSHSSSPTPKAQDYKTSGIGGYDECILTLEKLGINVYNFL